MIRPRPFSLAAQASCLGAQLEQLEVGGVVEPKRRALEVLTGAKHLLPVALRDLSLAELVVGDPRPAGDEPVGELGLRHLEREEGDRDVELHRDVLGDVADERRLADRRTGGDDDQVARLKAAEDLVEIAKSGRGAGDTVALGERLEPVDLVEKDVGELREVLRAVVVCDLEQQCLSALDQLARLAAVVADRLLDPVACLEQAPQQRLALDDLRVVLGVPGQGPPTRSARSCRVPPASSSSPR